MYLYICIYIDIDIYGQSDEMKMTGGRIKQGLYILPARSDHDSEYLSLRGQML